MGRWRVTIAGSMGLVALAAFCLAALRYPSPLMASLAYSLVLAALFAAAVTAICRPGRPRAVCGSFALCGFGYLRLSMAGDTGMLQCNPPATILTPLVDIGHDLIMRRHLGMHKLGAGVEYWCDPFTLFPGNDVAPFLQIIHSGAALVVATMGAIFARRLTAVSAELPDPVVADPPPPPTPRPLP